VTASKSTRPARLPAEREAAVAMVEQPAYGNAGADKAYDIADFVAEMRRLGVTPHVSQNDKGRRSMAAPRATPAMRPACDFASASRKCSAGSRRWVDCPRLAIAARRWSGGCSRWRRRHTTSYGSQSCWPRQCRNAGSLSHRMILARQFSRNPENAVPTRLCARPGTRKTRCFAGLSATCGVCSLARSTGGNHHGAHFDVNELCLVQRD
jgi:hypothetical protein